MWRAGYGFYDAVKVYPVELSDKPGRVLCEIVPVGEGQHENDKTYIVDTTGELDESEFWCSGSNRKNLLAWMDLQMVDVD